VEVWQIYYKEKQNGITTNCGQLPSIAASYIKLFSVYVPSTHTDALVQRSSSVAWDTCSYAGRASCLQPPASPSTWELVANSYMNVSWRLYLADIHINYRGIL
jgi:hypothetical protein